MVVRAEDLNLDSYMIFLENGVNRDFPNRLLNQIISLHGFKKMHKVPKKTIADALCSINPSRLFRSTLTESISSMVPLTKDEVATDLATLSWKECALQTIETLTSPIDTPDCGIEECGNLVPRPSSWNRISVDGPAKKRRRRTRKNQVGLEQLLLPYWPTM
ncbi:hypothetical protein Syun_028680 [Stephania yunnanensis]|uniref:DUF7787 domain-containing protein n=1 Tax=Stephania yunnanensis TaxID=152371 RepID=A0AAP0E493_9MAGN